MRGLFYSHHLAGVGHLVRSLNICRELVQYYDIDFIQGGIDAPHLPIKSPRFHAYKLHPIGYIEGQYPGDPNGLLSLEELQQKRKKTLLETFNKHYDFLITEHFPFGRLEYFAEIVPLINQAKVINPRAIIISCARDLMNVTKKTTVNLTSQLLHKFFDKVLVISDPKIVGLNKTFYNYPDIQDMVLYTGYVVGPKTYQDDCLRQKVITVSIGGGPHGEELIKCVAETAPYFQDYKFQIFTGINFSAGLKHVLANIKDNPDISNVTVNSMSEDFDSILRQSALSISLCGYNTVMSILNTHTPAIIYPDITKEEQQLRAKIFSEKGIFQVLTPEELNPQTLAKKIHFALSTPYQNINIDLNGAETFTKIVQDLLK
jgi:predicted glycosyltransferase